MKNHYLFSDEEFEQQFQDCSFDPEFFSHEAHLRLAWIHIQKYGVEKASEQISNQIFEFVSRLGHTDKFNKTVTIAAVKAVDHFVKKSKSSTFKEFIAEFPQLKTNLKGLLAFHYSFDIFQSESAKIQYLQPDLLPFE